MLLKTGTRLGLEALAFSPDSALLAGASGDNCVYIWDPVSGSLKHLLKGDTTLRGLAFSKDGTSLFGLGSEHVNGTYNAFVQAWNVQTGREKERRVFPGPGPRYLASDAKVIVTVPADPDTGKGRAKHAIAQDTFGKHSAKLQDEAPVEIIAISRDNKSIAVVNRHGRLNVFDYPEGSLRWSAWPKEGIRSLAFSPDGKSVATVGQRPPSVYLWDAETGKTGSAVAQLATVIDFSPNGKLIAGNRSDDILLWSVGKKEPVAQLRLTGDGKSTNLLAFSPDGRFLAAAGRNSQGQVRLWLIPKLNP